MGFLDGLLRSFGLKNNNNTSYEIITEKSEMSYADANSIDEDEKSFYQTDDYYTMESYPGTMMAQKVITFEERKKTSFPSRNGLYVAEILLLEYCREGNYPKPSSGYPGFWWFAYGIRDVGHTLEAVQQKGFLKWGTKKELLKSLKVNELKEIAFSFNIKTTQSKQNLIKDIENNIKEEDLPDKYFSKKYVLTELGEKELKENEYVIYMHKHKYKTREDSPRDLSFTVWDINTILADKDKSKWKEYVADLEEKRFGFRMADKIIKKEQMKEKNNDNVDISKEEMISYINDIMPKVKESAKKKGDGLKEELEGLDYKNKGDYKKALYYLYIAIEKNFDAPALYRETAKILRKYKMFDEELRVINIGLNNIGINNSHRNELQERKEKIEKLLKK